MSFAGVVIACWLGIAGVAFLAISGLGRLAARGDGEAELGIVGDAELRMLLGDRGRDERRGRIEARLAHLGMPGGGTSWLGHNHLELSCSMAHTRPELGHSSYTT